MTGKKSILTVLSQYMCRLYFRSERKGHRTIVIKEFLRTQKCHVLIRPTSGELKTTCLIFDYSIIASKLKFQITVSMCVRMYVCPHPNTHGTIYCYIGINDIVSHSEHADNVQRGATETLLSRIICICSNSFYNFQSLFCVYRFVLVGNQARMVKMLGSCFISSEAFKYLVKFVLFRQHKKTENV